MKALSFNSVEILPSLLDKSKTQTIRPAWDTATIHKDKTNGSIFITPDMTAKSGNLEYLKPHRYKVGDICSIIWKQRTSPKGSWFCRRCGKISQLTMVDGKEATTKGIPKSRLCHCQGYWKEWMNFPKLIGEVRITEVFEIEVSRKNLKVFGFQERITIPWEYPRDVMLTQTLGHLYIRDGFKSAEQMFQFFDKKYDLSTQKRFAVYRWEWI